MHSNLPPKIELYIFGYKIFKTELELNRNQTKIGNGSIGFFDSSILCTPLQEKILIDTSNHKLKPIEYLNAALLGFNLNTVFVKPIDVQIVLLWT